jgi:Flp pilus assembly protein TadD
VEEAVPHISAAVKLNPNNVEARFNLAVALAAQGKLDDAIRQLQTAVELAPNRPEIRAKLTDLQKSRK